ncbi:MAG: DUF3185 domain-containing protein [Acidobacteria bacterium]|nr:DUF3185 domain-containing protein [Acidobacteriota bacterium]
MKIVQLAGIALIVLGLIGLIYGGISYKTQKEVVRVGPLEATVEEEKTLPIPPIVGGVAVGVGVALLLVGARRKS